MEKNLKNTQKILEPLSNAMMITEINDIELVKTITKENKIKKKVGIYYYNGYILEIKSVENKKIFFIREKDESRIR